MSKNVYQIIHQPCCTRICFLHWQQWQLLWQQPQQPCPHGWHNHYWPLQWLKMTSGDFLCFLPMENQLRLEAWRLILVGHWVKMNCKSMEKQGCHVGHAGCGRQRLLLWLICLQKRMKMLGKGSVFVVVALMSVLRVKWNYRMRECKRNVEELSFFRF